MKANKTDLQNDTRRTEAVTAELSEAELSVVSGGKASGVLMQKCVTGKHFANMKLTA